MNHLPEELLRIILCHVGASYGRTVILASVCKVWHRVAWSTLTKLHLRKFPEILIGFTFDDLIRNAVEATEIFMPTETEDFHLSITQHKLPNLNSIILRRCRMITNKGMEAFKDRPLQRVCLSTSWNISCLDFLSSSTSSLEYLELRGCDELVDNSFLSLASAISEPFTKLTFLDIRDCKLLTDEICESISTIMPNVQHLDLSGCSITGTGLKYLCQLPHLSTLLLWGCEELTDNGIQHLANCNALQMLNLLDCSLLSDRGLQFLSNSRALQHLELGSNGITARGIGYLQHLKTLEQLGILCDFNNNVSLTQDAIQSFLPRFQFAPSSPGFHKLTATIQAH